MATAAVTYTFAPLTLIESAKGNTNFQDLVTFLNNSVQHNDGSKVYTGVPSGPSSDPVSDNQFTRKAYVDRGPKLNNSLFVPSGIRSTTSASYVDWPAGEVYSISHTKKLATTEILVMFTGSAYNTGTGVMSEYAIKVDAGGDTSLAGFFFNVASTHFSVAGFVRIPGLSAASHTYTLRAKTSANELRVDTQDHLRLQIMECN